MNDLIKFSSKITDEISLWVDTLQKENPEKDFTFLVSETYMFWSVNWESIKYLKEYFQVELWNDNAKFTIRGEDAVEDVFEHFNEEYFIYQERTIKELLLDADEIIQKIKEGVLVASNN